ncbi:MAG: hypothetical protein ACREM2_02905 [Vulcanimicrobiaceae bacterium]
MRFALSLLAALAAISLVACGGGSSGTPAPRNTSLRPAASGDAFAFRGTLVQTFTRPPSPGSANPPNAETFSYDLSQSVAVVGGAVFDGVPSLFDFKTTETQTLLAPSVATTTHSDFFESYAQHGASTNVILVGSQVQSSDGSVTTDLPGPGNGLLDVLPEKPGPIEPTNNASAKTSESDPDGQTTVQSINADGSYTQTTTYPDGSSATATENADGSASYALPLLGPSLSGGAQTTIAYGLPSGGFIPITVAIPAAISPSGNAETQTPSVPVWYPNTPPALYAQTYVNDGPAPLPSSCAASAASGGSANRLVQTMTTLDSIFGELDVQTMTSFTQAGLGVVCEQFTDDASLYYDFSGQTPMALAFSANGEPLEIIATSETLGLVSATVLGTQVRGRALAGGTLALARPSLAGVKRLLARERRARHSAFLHAAMTEGGRR